MQLLVRLRGAPTHTEVHALHTDPASYAASGVATPPAAPLAEPRPSRKYAHVALSLRLNRGQRKELDRLKSRRGVAKEASAITLTVHADVDVAMPLTCGEED